MSALARLLPIVLIGLAAGCGTPPPPSSMRGSPVSHDGSQVRFAVIGDYGLAGPDEAAVAELVASWAPEMIITLGDNNYPNGRADTIDDNVGQYYHAFIHPYAGRYGDGADENRFFPALGNHDWRTHGAWPYLEYFTLPGNERYYEHVWGPVHLFAIDSDREEPDGIDPHSVQGQWLRERLAASHGAWKVVYMHHAPYSSGDHGSSEMLRWPFAQWGADLVLAGHDHHYERLAIDGIVYVVNGLGGNPERYQLRNTLPGSAVRWNGEHGAMVIEASTGRLELRFVTVSGREVDRHVLLRESPA
ncbi:metallophosphoesterase family protein [Paraliomyxa miuraensis]|uniref:metallophosphoesterase family protein n=1 Tax=Paraliomyxa miuraensis TaxID=376150 RepID=UPI0022538BC3|nr:metallophosphoesterase [Paraliomyxa miuraensis]MCX4246973.1 metallophosphoesterase [Paraliomyxa miuraensis]